MGGNAAEVRREAYPIPTYSFLSSIVRSELEIEERLKRAEALAGRSTALQPALVGLPLSIVLACICSFRSLT